jgi:hypothetical protein
MEFGGVLLGLILAVGIMTELVPVFSFAAARVDVARRHEGLGRIRSYGVETME